eukprot:4144669-Pleurochrysis_carterae.AAC.3
MFPVSDRIHIYSKAAAVSARLRRVDLEGLLRIGDQTGHVDWHWRVRLALGDERAEARVTHRAACCEQMRWR